MKEISYPEAIEYANSLPAPPIAANLSLPHLDSNEQLVLRIALDLFGRLGIRNPKSFLDDIFVTGKQRKERDFDLLTPLLAGGKVVLDAGCGWGGLSRMLLNAGQSVFSVDHVFEHANATKLLCPEARVFHANAMELPFLQSGSIDISILMGVIEHVGTSNTPRGRSGTNALQQYRLVHELSRVTATNGHLFLNTGNAFFPRDGETHLWFYHWLPPQEQNLYNELASISADNYWLLTWEELTLILNLCGYEIFSVHSPDTDYWNCMFIDGLDRCFSGLDQYIKDALKRLVKEDPRYFSSWNLCAKKTRPPTPLDCIDFASIMPSFNYLPYRLLLSRFQAINSDGYSISLRDLSHCINKRPVWIWGAGQGGKNALPRLKEAGIEVAGFIDNDHLKDGSLFLELPVTSPSRLLKDHLSNVYVFVASVFVSVIESQLKDFGLEYIRDYFILTVGRNDSGTNESLF